MGTAFEVVVKCNGDGVSAGCAFPKRFANFGNENDENGENLIKVPQPKTPARRPRPMSGIAACSSSRAADPDADSRSERSWCAGRGRISRPREHAAGGLLWVRNEIDFPASKPGRAGM
jgi:hypothetical protein